MICNKDNQELKDRITKTLRVIHIYDWLLDLYVLDYFVDNHWEKLPKPWKECFDSMEPSDAGHILMGTYKSSHLLPLSFMALMRVINLLSIPRKATSTSNCDIDNLSNKMNLSNITSCSHLKLKNIFMKHVKLKKRHEIEEMSRLVSSIATEINCPAVLDFGSGLGHLMRVLAYKYKMTTAGIESQFELTSEARKLDHELEYTMKKHISQEYFSEVAKPLHINITLSSEKQLQELKLSHGMQKYGLIGLHPCGDLGPLLIRHFVNSSNVKFICLVGCCYMKLSCNTDSVVKNGYPMSHYIQSLKNNHLSYPSREIACHAIELYCERLKSGKYEDLKVHAYRAALELLLVGADPSLKHSQVGNVKHVSRLSFEEYCSVALARTGVKNCIDVSCAGGAAARDWKRVVIFYTLRLALAPLVETVILLDRLLYLKENGLHCEIRPVFEPTISPRNNVLIARRL